MLAAAQEEKSGEALAGKYRVLAELGQGGTANVYLAVARGPSGFKKLVVLKTLRKNLADDQEFRNMFLNEARLAARLNHSNIVQTNEIFEDRGVPVIVMEYLDGQALSSILGSSRRDAFTLPMHLRVIVEALHGIHCAHELADFDGTAFGVVHRDLTPHNVFVTFDGQIKVLDFGIAKLRTSTVETQVGVIKGKLQYMAPEQISGETIDRRADIFAAGVMLWEALAGTRMWSGVDEATIMSRVLNGEIPRPSEQGASVAPQLEEICMKALAEDPDDRFPSAAAFAAELEKGIADVGITVSSRAVGKLVAEVFADKRAKVQSLIERQLGAVLAAEEAGGGLELGPTPVMSFPDLARTATGSTTLAGPMSSQERRAGWWPFVALGMAVAAFASWRFVQREPEAAAAKATVPADNPVAAVQPPPLLPQTIELRISSLPAGAVLYLDGERLPDSPFSQRVPLDRARHVIRAEAKGYQSAIQGVIFDRDLDVKLALGTETETPTAVTRHPVFRPPVHNPGTKPVEPKPGPDEQKPKKPNCDPPYVLDARGIKKFKPECL